LPNPLTINVSGTSNGTGTVTLTNTAPAGGASLIITGDNVPLGGSVNTWFFGKVAGQDTCAGANLAPGASCTVQVRFTNVNQASTTNHSVTMTFTDNATGTQSVTLTGHVN
jgi:hypothetical protein